MSELFEMSNVSNLIVNETKTAVSWSYAGTDFRFSAQNIGQAIEDAVHERVIISLCKGEYPYQIKVLKWTGEEQFSFDEPKPFEFYYLKKHSIFGVSIVCTSDKPIDGRMDWQFEVDYEAGQLKRVAPSY
jgi:hypothetical protein